MHLLQDLLEMDREFFFEYHLPPVTKGSTAKVYELLERRVEEASRHYSILRITPDLREHIALVTGLRDEITNLEQSRRPDADETIDRLNRNLDELTEHLSNSPELKKTIDQIKDGGLTFPVVPRGDETIRFQINAAHTAADIEQVLAALAELR